MFDTLTEKFTQIFATVTGKRKLTAKNVNEACGQVRRALIDADVNYRVVRDFVERVKTQVSGLESIPGVDPGQMFIQIVHAEIQGLLGPTDDRISFNPTGPTVILMAGLQGSGKTTTCAKLAHLLLGKGRHPLLVAADVQRPAAIEQLQILGEQVGVPVYAEPGGHPPTICENAVYEAKKTGRDTVILDTAGRLHIDEELMAELKEVCRRTVPQETFLVCDAMTGQDAVNSADEFNKQLEISGVILTKLDGDARGGAALSIKAVTQKTIKFVGVSEKIDGLEPFHPDRMAGRILGMGDVVSLVEIAQETYDQDQARAQAEKLFSARFNLEDMLDHLDKAQQMAQKKGGFGSLIGMIPGASHLLGGEEVDDGEFARMKAVIQSMTREERTRPELVDGSRRRRIALGSGSDPRAVSQVLKQHKEMKKMMSGKGKLAGVMDMLFGGGNGAFDPAAMGFSVPKSKAVKSRPTQKEKKRRRKKGRKGRN